MPPTHSDLGYGAIESLLTTTLANYREQLIDNIFDDYPLLSYLNGRLAKGMRGETALRLVGGGESIIEHLMYGTNSTVSSYAGAELLDTTLQEGMTLARYTWKQYSGTIGITGLEERSNSGEQAMINLLTAKATQTEMTLRDTMSVDAFADGTGNGSKALTGLSAIVDDAGTLGGIDSSVYTWWTSQDTTSGSFAGQGLDDMTTTINTITFGNDKPDIAITHQTPYEYFHKALQPQERFMNTMVADAGFVNLSWLNVPVIFDRDCDTDRMYFLNSKWLKFVVHTDANFTTTPFMRPENQDVLVAQILFQGNITTNNRRKLGVMKSISA